MKLYCKFFCLLPFLGVLLLYAGCAACSKTITHPLVWNMEELDRIKLNSNSEYYKSIINKADKFCESKPVVVTDKIKTFAPDNHYYCSMSSYWWPDPQDPAHYINRDGYVNPERNQYDRNKLTILADRCQTLSKAFFITENEKYYYFYIQQLSAWFTNESTLMYPNFEYSQVVPGQRNNKGKSSGMIDAYSFNTVIESIRLVNSVKKIDFKTLSSLQMWFYNFAEWALRVYGGIMQSANNNVSLAYDVTLANMYIFARADEKAKIIADSFASKRINRQIEEDGKQPAELKRTKAFSYSVYNLTHIIDFCLLARYWDKSYYVHNGKRVDAAISFLDYYIDNKNLFPYQQITSWEECRKTFDSQRTRIEILRRERKE